MMTSLTSTSLITQTKPVKRTHMVTGTGYHNRLVAIVSKQLNDDDARCTDRSYGRSVSHHKPSHRYRGAGGSPESRPWHCACDKSTMRLPVHTVHRDAQHARSIPG